jgi:hypothetical protein
MLSVGDLAFVAAIACIETQKSDSGVDLLFVSFVSRTIDPCTTAAWARVFEGQYEVADAIVTRADGRELVQRATACNGLRHSWQPWRPEQRRMCKL